MKKLLFIYLLLACFTASADSRSSELLGKMSAAIRSWKSYKVEFVLSASPSSKAISGTYSGSYTVSGQKYRLNVEGNDVYCDGVTKYEVNGADKEVTVDKVNPKDKSILSNPTKAFEFSDDNFTHSYAGQMTYAGRKCDIIKLHSRTESPISGITLMLDVATALPVAMTYLMEGVSDQFTLEVRSIKQLSSVPDAEFRFDKSKYKGFEIVDFR